MNPSQSIEDQLQRIAEKIDNLGLSAPALFFLEAHLPVTSLVHTSTIMLAPLATPLFGAERLQNLQAILSNRQNIESLITMIENRTCLKSN